MRTGNGQPGREDELELNSKDFMNVKTDFRDKTPGKNRY